MKKLVFVLIIALFLVAIGLIGWVVVEPILTEREIEQPVDTRMLFIGNSFTDYNELDQLVANLVGDVNQNDVYGQRVAPGGFRLIDHFETVEASEETMLRRLLVSGTAQARDWDLIVMQEQSQLPALGGEHMAGSPYIQQYAGQTSDTQMLMMTWGYADGDSMNPNRFATFLQMQGYLVQGYDDLAAQMSAYGNKVYIAPAGLGFLAVYNDLQAIGQDPLAADSLFRQLYVADGKHPSLQGSYLAAAIVAASYTGKSMESASWKPRGLDAETAAYLRRIADRVVFGNEFSDREYPWEE
mgnify:CR=1 FL=1